MPEHDEPSRILEARALALLARREYTRAELAQRLRRPPRPRPALRKDRARPESKSWADEFAPPPEPGRPGADLAHDAFDGDHDADAAAAVSIQDRDALIETVLDRLEAGGLLSDQRAAEAIVHARASGRGMLRIAQELEQKGVPDTLAEPLLAELRAQQVPAAREVWRKRFGHLPADAAERARQTRFLAGRGFSFDVIRVVLGADQD